MVKKNGMGLVSKLIMMAIASVLVTAAGLFVISAVRISSTYRSLIREELAATGAHLQSQFANAYDGDWTLSEDGRLLKGGTDVSEDFQKEIDALNEETGVEYTLFYGDQAMISTIEASNVSAEVTNAVLSGGNIYYSSSITIAEKRYFGYYIPMQNSDGSIAGMCFTGRSADDVSGAIIRIMIMLILVAIVIVIVVAVLGVILSRSVSGKMRDVSGDLTKLADGSLSVEVDEEIKQRGDELGEIGNSVENLIHRLGDIIGHTKQMSVELADSGNDLARESDNATQVVSQISTAVEDISRGASSQAASIQTVADETNVIGDSISNIAENVDVLNDASVRMKDNCTGTMSALEMLILQAQKVVESVDSISMTIERTDRSAKEISAFTDEINSIASQTNLLSLNASIEAARAGETGKGFAVVANEISALAQQSKQSADKINEITNELMKDAGESVQVVHQLNEDIDEQGRQLDTTKEAMNRMEQGINYVAESATEITKQIDELRATRNALNDVIADLSAISEQNAASTAETNESMEALASTFSKISESAEGLRGLAGDLTDTISYFD